MLEFLAVLARRWRIVVGLVLIGVVAAGALVYQATPSYRASTQLFVALDSANSASELNFAASFSSQRVKSYPDLVSSPLVLEPTIEELGLDETSAELAADVTAEVPPNTVLIQVFVDNPSAVLAADIANSIAANLANVVEDLDRTREDSASPVRVSVTRPAVPPASPRTPVPLLSLTVGLLLGLLVGAALALLREVLDTSVRDESDVTETTGLPTLAHVPTNSDVASSPVLDATPAHPVWAESYRKLRTNLSYFSPDNPARVIMITSALPSEGKSLTATNLAASLGQSGQRTLLIDADLRRPSVAKVLRMTDDVGLTSVLTGRVDVVDLVQHRDTFDVLASGPLPPNPSELLGAQVFRDLIDSLRMEYDRIVIDTPPLVAVTDAAVVSTASDAVVIVAHANRTKRADLRRALFALRAVDANVFGVVLNQVAPNSNVYYQYDTVPRRAERRPERFERPERAEPLERLDRSEPVTDRS